ncbi:hypothetical protein FIV42_17535 [Persicimonas caeni]|uniref:Uncharacterized protein n=1 Tax=Persicimonas caeni TaxID=2292766 RepID=A0A4Y6PW49_PERCE|nr:hypothetical protein [Persicimonas caeni]QDG52473.1 hypothetical protein FIV42_17535 [Persicimonas caeni]QED33695.1 hypothetical protein FRD00_17530 [Persicimonas caeni]
MNNAVKEKPPGLWSSKPTALLATLAAGTGAIALGSIGVEIWTDQSLAQTASLGVAFVSAPLGLATLVLSALTARSNMVWSAPGFVFALAYWTIFALAA